MNNDLQEDPEQTIPDVYASNSSRLYARIARKGGPDLAQDIVQETWLRAVREWRKQGIPAKPAAWLATVSHNLLCNEFRRRQSVRLVDVDVETIQAEPDGVVLEPVDVDAEVREALSRLPPQESQLLDAFHLRRTPAAQLAAAMGISGRALEGRLRRARAKLRVQLADSPWRSQGHYGVIGQGINSGVTGVSWGGKMLTGALPLLLAIAIFPLTRLTRRLSRRVLGIARIVGGIGLFVIAQMAARGPWKLQTVGIAMALWGVWMLAVRPSIPHGPTEPRS